jgi:hypothetical protein
MSINKKRKIDDLEMSGLILSHLSKTSLGQPKCLVCDENLRLKKKKKDYSKGSPDVVVL